MMRKDYLRKKGNDQKEPEPNLSLRGENTKGGCV